MKAKFELLKKMGFPGLFFAAATGLSAAACLDFWNIPWGKGINGNPLSFKWGMAFLILVILCIALLGLALLIYFRPGATRKITSWISRQRSRLGIGRWAIGIFLAYLPACLLQFTYLGIVLSSMVFHIWLWVVTAILIGVLFTRKKDSILGWPGFLAGLLAAGSTYAMVFPFRFVTSYPFSLYWSEGNRFWDYSVLFGRRLFDYPAGVPIFAYIDLGRQLIWGLPFLLPHWSIALMRLWDGVLYTIPYFVFGWLALRKQGSGRKVWLLLATWAYLFLNQGPIYTPLIICAILVVIAWRRSLWIALPLVAVSGYFAQLSRWTWVFAPAIWAVMLEVGTTSSENQSVSTRTWLRAGALAVAGFLGRYLLSFLVSLWNIISSGEAVTSSSIAGVLTNAITGGAVLSNQPLFITIIGLFVICVLLAAVLWVLRKSHYWQVIQRKKTIFLWLLVGCIVVGGILFLKFMGVSWLNSLLGAVTDQPLLWYRLFPNATYGTGILIGLLMACGPLAAFLIYLRASHRWILSFWQQLFILCALVVFLGIGLVASVKIGGGGDLHNLDMFFIGMLFVAVLAWQNGKLGDAATLFQVPSIWTKVLLSTMIIIPVIQPLINIRPLLSAETYQQVKTLVNPSDLADVLPSMDQVNIAMDTIRAQVAESKTQGEVLFMDQRQLLTFGYIQNVLLVPDYEKKYMMDQALSDNEDYFLNYYRDLADQRFSLIITEPLNLVSNGETRIFGNENDAWVKWITAPTLCFYEPLFTFRDIRVELLVPRQDIEACNRYLRP